LRQTAGPAQLRKPFRDDAYRLGYSVYTALPAGNRSGVVIPSRDRHPKEENVFAPLRIHVYFIVG
jgi:hypothetical protein